MIVRAGCLLWLASSTLLLCSACQGKMQSLSLAMQDDAKMEAAMHKHRAYFDMMASNAAHKEMSVTDQHFMPHGSKLSGTGVIRLNRLAEILNTHGGSVHYATYMTNEKLIKARLDQVKDFLTATGCDMDHVSLVAGNSQSSWYLASDAVDSIQGDAAAALDGGASPVGGAPPKFAGQQ